MLRQHTILYLYRGVVIHWYRIDYEFDPPDYVAAWEWEGRWHTTPAFTTADRAVASAENRIDKQQAARPALSY